MSVPVCIGPPLGIALRIPAETYETAALPLIYVGAEIAVTKGVQKWVIQVDRDTMAGTYTYTDDQEGRPGGSPVTIYVTGRASGTVTLVLDPDGRAKMHLKETSHTITARTDGGGVGQELGAPLSEFDLTWEVGAAC